MEDEVHGFGGEGDAYQEPRRPAIRGGCSAGRIVNGCVILNYLLVLLTALIVAGSLGVLDNKLAKHYPDSSTKNRTCILFTHCDGPTCQNIIYNSSGGCDFIVAGFILIALFAVVYMVISVVRIVFSTDIYLTVIADIVANVVMVVTVMVMGITVSIGLAITCSEVNKHYGSSGLQNCSARPIPDNKGYQFYRETNVAQGAAWFCFMFLFFSMVLFLVRSCILCRRRASIPAMDDTEILTAQDNYEETGEGAKPI